MAVSSSRSGKTDAAPGRGQRRSRVFGTICQTLSGKSKAALILSPVARESGKCARPRHSLHAPFDRARRPSSVRSAMFIVTTTPERSVKLRRSGTQGGPPPTSGSVRVSSNTCRSYGAWPTAARLTIDMALLTELSTSPLLPPRRASDARKLKQMGADLAQDQQIGDRALLVLSA
jgi:hypothetical protein